MSQPWRSEKVRRPRAEVQAFVNVLKVEMPQGVDWVLGGSWRREAPEIGDLDVIVVTEDGTLTGFELPRSFHPQHHGSQIIQGDLAIRVPGRNHDGTQSEIA